MHIGVCDDCIEELTHISLLIEKYRSSKELPITYECFQSTTELLETMPKRQFDTLFLDILMPGITGMEAAREIRQWNDDVSIIFLTSSSEFAVQSYRVNASDYILKPAAEHDIFLSLDNQLVKIKITAAESYLVLKTAANLAKLPLSKIVYVEVSNRTVIFTLVNGEIRKVYGYLADYENDLLSHPAFIKPHRSYLVNLHYVTGLDKSGFTTTVGKTVPVARDAFTNAKAAYTKVLLMGKDEN